MPYRPKYQQLSHEESIIFHNESEISVGAWSAIKWNRGGGAAELVVTLSIAARLESLMLLQVTDDDAAKHIAHDRVSVFALVEADVALDWLIFIEEDVQVHLSEVQVQRLSLTTRGKVRWWLKHLAIQNDTDPPSDIAVAWVRWLLWAADEHDAIERFQEGVVECTAGLIDGARDPDRGGRVHLDFCLRLSDSFYLCVHRGAIPKLNALPRFILPEIQIP